MNFSKFFQEAEKQGLEQAQISYYLNKETRIKLFEGEIDSFDVMENFTIRASGIYQGKYGSTVADKPKDDIFPELVANIKRNASLSEEKSEVGIFPGSPKYVNKNVFCKELSEESLSEKIANLKVLNQSIVGFDERIKKAYGPTYTESETTYRFANSFGLNLKRKYNFAYYTAGAIAEENGETKTFSDFVSYTGKGSVDFKAFGEEVAKKAVSKFAPLGLKSGKYPTVINKDIMGDFISYFLSSTIADEVQRHSSFLEGKLNERVVSRKLTIKELPLEKGPCFVNFDDEGVATKNKTIIDKGVLKTYLYNRSTALKDGVESTGNGSSEGGKIKTAVFFTRVKKGKKGFAEMIAPIQEGVYITEIAGLGTGMNAKSGNFSCQAEGYLIKDGRLDKPLNLITLSGNLLSMLKDVKDLDNASCDPLSSVDCPNVYIKKMSIGGE